MKNFSTTTYERTADGVDEAYAQDAIPLVTGLYCVEVSDNKGRSYATNMLRWREVDGAKYWASGLAMRWFGCTDIRVRMCDENGDPTGDTVYQTLES
jgi:hypothetical protein